MKNRTQPLNLASAFRRTRRSILAASVAALFAAGAMSASAQIFVVNGGFENGNFFGWTQSGNTASTSVSMDLPHSGLFAAHLGPVTTHGFLTQNIRTLVGGTYTLRYFLENDGGAGTFFSSKLNGVKLSSMTNAAAFSYTQFVFTGFQGTGTSIPLQFEFRQDPAYWNLDDVSLELVNLRNSSVVNFGSVRGVLPITQNFTQTSKGVLQIQVGGLGTDHYDSIQVGNKAKLDGRLEVLKTNNFHFQRGDKVTILTANDGISGEFASYGTDFGDTILAPIPIYHKHSVVLEVPKYEYFATVAGLSSNEIAVARAIDSVVSDPREDALVRHLDKQHLSELPDAFDRIAPEELTSAFTIGVSLAQVQSLNIQRRTDDIRSGSSGFSAAGLAINGSVPGYSGPLATRSGVAGPNGNDGKESKETKNVALPEENRWGVFLSGTGEWVSVGNTDNARGYDLESGGFTLGVDYKVAPNVAIGLAAGYMNTTADLVDGGRIHANGGKIGFYATFFQNEPQVAAQTMSKDSPKDSSKEAPASALSIAKGFYADTAVFGGYNSYSSHRSALLGKANGDTDGGELNVLFGIGYDFKVGGLTFGPTASFNYTYLGTNGFTEHGSLAPLDVHGGKGESLRTAIGLKASYDWKVGGILIKPEIRAAWQHEYGDAAYELTSSFANGGGEDFTVDGPQIGRDSVLLGAGFAIQCSERCSTFVYYDGELGRKNYQSTAVTGGFRFAF